MKLFKHFTDTTQGVRRLGAASIDLCHLASGVVDGFWELGLHPWDTAAGIVIVEEAGGKITDVAGNELVYNTDIVNHENGLLVTNGFVHNEVVSKISDLEQNPTK